MTRKMIRRSRSGANSHGAPAPSREPAVTSLPVGTAGMPTEIRLSPWDGGLFDGRRKEVGLGIDPSLSGTALVAVCGDLGYGWRFKPKEGLKGVRRLASLSLAVDGLLRLLLNNGCVVSHVCMEGYSYGQRAGTSQAHSIGEGGAAIKLALYAFLPEPVGYPTIVAPTALKKFVTSRGTAAKNEMLMGVYKKWGAEFSDDNLADAYSLARLACAVRSPDTVHHKYERDVLANVKEHTEWMRPESSSSPTST